MTSDQSILWTLLDGSGHDACRLVRFDGGWHLDGAAVFTEAGMISCLSYRIECDALWETRLATVTGWAGSREIGLRIAREPEGGWMVNGTPAPTVSGCRDIDLGFTPATNTVAIRRMDLAVGASEAASAAWLDTADWVLKPLGQVYRCCSADTFEYSSPAHGFQARLTTDPSGLVREYPGLWRAIG